MSLISNADVAKTKSKHVTSKQMTPMQEVKVKALASYSDVRKGTIVTAMLLPHGNIYLKAGLVGCFETNAQEGIHFEFID